MSENLVKSNFTWIRPLLLLLSISVSIFLFNRLVDSILLYFDIKFLAFLYDGDVANLTNTMGGLSDVVISILGIEITVIAIIVQLAANKYSERIMEMVLENKVNALVISMYVVAAVNTLLVTNTITGNFIPYFSISVTMLFIIVSIIIVIPHFSYVFNFLRPEVFLDYVKRRILKRLEKINENPEKYVVEDKDSIVEDINFLGDIALNSIAQSDRAVALQVLSLLRDVTIRYLELKPTLPEKWYAMTGKEYLDPDFSSYSRFVMNLIEHRKIFLERKIFRLFEMLFDNSRMTLRDVASGVLLNSELIASGAIVYNDKEVLRLVYQYFNSYLRIAIRGRDPRSAFNCLEHYRMVAEMLLDSDPEEVEKISFYFKYYGQEANKYQVLFILETAAHDLCVINELAYDKKVKNRDVLLKLFLTLDEPLEESSDNTTSTKELSLIGVRVAQAKLAGYYLLRGDRTQAEIIFQDMKIEPLNRIRKIKDIIFTTTEEEFWEITPRGVNFNYVSLERRDTLNEFFSWFEKEPQENISKKN